MARKTKYSMEELKSLWPSYDKAKTMRVLKDGTWIVTENRGMIPGATKAEIVPMSQVKTFPEYLESLEA